MINTLTSNLYNNPPYDSSMCYAYPQVSNVEAPYPAQAKPTRRLTHVTTLLDKQLATLELAFSKLNFGRNITIWRSENTSGKLRETADLINRKLDITCPAALQIDLFRLCSVESNKTIYQSQTKSVKGSISLPVKPESLSYIDAGEVSCLLIDVRTADGTLARVDISVISAALEKEYLDRVRTKLLTSWAAPTFQ